MNVSIQVQLTPQSEALLAAYRRAPQEFPQALKRGMTRALEVVAGRIQQNRLTGVGPFPPPEHRLGERTTRLRRSVRATPAIVISEGQQSVVEGAIGSNVKYAAVHEFGFTGSVNVKAFVRKNPRGDILAKFNPISGRSTRTTKKIASGVSNVRAHTRRMNIPERAPFRTGIGENLEYIAGEIQKELIATLQK
jgi:phage gpG-like protein